MDLTEISREQAAIDLEIANVRILELSVAIQGAAEELRRLREIRVLREREDALSKSMTVEYADDRALAPSAAGLSRTSLVDQIKRKVGLGPQTLLFSVDEVCGRAPVLSQNGALAKVARSEFRSCAVRGWAFPAKAPAPLTTLEVVLSGNSGQVRQTVNFQNREDVARHFGNSALVRAGFVVEIPMSKLVPGIYMVELVGRTDAGSESRARALEVEIL